MSASDADQELKQKHKAMWGSGDYPVMVETFLLPLGPRLVEACGIGPRMRVLDVAAGTGNAAGPAAAAAGGARARARAPRVRAPARRTGPGRAAGPAAAAGAEVIASDLTPRLLEAGHKRAEA